MPEFGALFGFNVHPLEIIVRGSAVYWLLFALFRFVRRLVAPPPLTLIRNGRLLRANMRREMVTLEELQSALREHGIEQASQVRIARMEGDGIITVIRRQDGAADGPPRQRAGEP